MNIYITAACLIIIFIFAKYSAAEENKIQYFDRDISVLETEEELISFLERMNQYDQVDKEYIEEKEEKKKKETKPIAIQIVDGLTADEIGDIPALSIGHPLETSFGRRYGVFDDFKIVDDYLIILNEETLVTIDINKDSVDEPELISQVTVDSYIKKAFYSKQKLLVENNLVVAVNVSGSFSAIEFSFFHITEDGEIEFDQRYTISDANLSGVHLSDIKIVDGRLMFVAKSNDFEIEEIIENSKFNSLSAYFKDSSLEPVKEVDIASGINWISTSNEFRGLSEYSSDINDFNNTVLFNCPLNELPDKDFHCEVTNLLGVDKGRSFFFNNGSVIYIWTDSIPKFAYDKFSKGEYSEFIRSANGKKIHNDLYVGHYESMIYRVNIEDGDVGAVVFGNSPPLGREAFKESYGAFVGFIGDVNTNTSEQSYKLSALIFEDFNFSDQPTVLPKEHFQVFEKKSEHYFLGFSGENALIASSNNTKSEPELFLFNIETKEGSILVLDFKVDDYLLAEDVLLIIGRDEKGFLRIESWSVSGDPEIIDQNKLSKILPFNNQHFVLNSREFEGDYFIDLSVSKIESEADDSDKDKSKNNVQGKLPIKFDKDGLISFLGGFYNFNSEDCNDFCAENFENSEIFFVEDYVYYINGESVIKGDFSSEGFEEVSRLNIDNQ